MKAARDSVRWTHLPLLALLAWWTLRLGSASETWCFLDYVNLAFHEAGHLVFAPFGSTPGFLGGALGQLAVPALLVIYFLTRRHHPFAAALCAWWVGENLSNVAVYMADARSLALPLVGGGDHDWNELFYRFGLLGEDSVAAISTMTRRLGVAVMLAGIAWTAYFVMPSGIRERVSGTLSRRFPSAHVILE